MLTPVLELADEVPGGQLTSAAPWQVRQAGVQQDRITRDRRSRDGQAASNGTRTGDSRAASNGAGAGDRHAVPGSRATRPAVEIYVAGDLADVVVATHVAPQILRGSRRTVCRGAHPAIAWGRLPTDGSGVTVIFCSGLLRPRTWTAQVIEITSWCWLAMVDGRYDRVLVTGSGTGERVSMRAGGRR